MSVGLVPEAHGGIRADELLALGIDPASVLDFSTNVSPIGPPAGVARAIREADVASYPDQRCTKLVQRLSDVLDVPAAQILCGNGSSELIHLLARVFVRRGQRPIALAPTFGEYANAVALGGGEIYDWRSRAERGFRPVLKNKPDVLRRVTPPLVFVCNPNNPTGVYLDRRDVTTLSNSLTAGPMVLDEAYINFIDDPWRSLDLVGDGRVIVLRSMTKDYGLAGLRLGYLVAHPDVVEEVRRVQPPWSVSSVAQAAGVAALDDADHLRRVRDAVRAGKRTLLNGLRALDLPVVEGAANFVLVQVGNAGALRARLLRHGVQVRDCASFGLPEHIRIGVRSPADCARLCAALQAALGEGPLPRHPSVATPPESKED